MSKIHSVPITKMATNSFHPCMHYPSPAKWWNPMDLGVAMCFSLGNETLVNMTQVEACKVLVHGTPPFSLPLKKSVATNRGLSTGQSTK